MSDKKKESQVGQAYITADATEDGKLIIIKIKLPEKLKSFQQLSHILNAFLSRAEFKILDKGPETPVQ